MAKLEDITAESIGKKYGKLTCLEYSHLEHGVGYFFKFKCDCGKEKIYNISRVRNGYIKSCGCLRKENSRKAIFKDLTGQTFNYLTVLHYVGQKNGRTMWKCRCECGNEVIVGSASLKSGNTKACGCHQKDGWGTNKTHGMTKTRIYRIWRGILNRCYYHSNKYYCNYGGRGIGVCDEWKNDFQAFYDWAMSNGYSNDLTIDRIDNDKNYCPENCQWVTRTIQMNNTRNNHLIEYKGDIKTIAEWAREMNLPYGIIRSRICTYGWGVDKALETPVQKRGGNYKVNRYQ